jgi:hypothetical protein
MTGPNVTNYIFYLCLLVGSGVGEYFHVVPQGTTAVVLGGILGHGTTLVSSAIGANTVEVATSAANGNSAAVVSDAKNGGHV